MNIIICAQLGHIPHRPNGIPFDFIKDTEKNMINGCVDICMRCQVLYAHDEYAGLSVEALAAELNPEEDIW